VLSELNRRFRLNESVLRHLVVHREEYTPPPVEEPMEGMRGRRDRDDLPIRSGPAAGRGAEEASRAREE